MAGHPKILIIDDDSIDRRLISNAFRSVGEAVEILTAIDGVDALNQLDAGANPDVVVFDLQMPRMDGLTFLGKLRNDDRLRLTPAIAFSTSRDSTDISLCYEGQANAYVQKPTSRSAYAVIAKSIWEFWIQCAERPVMMVPRFS